MCGPAQSGATATDIGATGGLAATAVAGLKTTDQTSHDCQR